MQKLQNLDPAIRFVLCSHLSADAASSRFSTPTFGKKEEKKNKNHQIATTSHWHVNLNDAAPANNDCTWEVSINVICS